MGHSDFMDLLGISEYVSPHKRNNGWIYKGLPPGATLAEKDLLLQTEAKTQNRNYLKEI